MLDLVILLVHYIRWEMETTKSGVHRAGIGVDGDCVVLTGVGDRYE